VIYGVRPGSTHTIVFNANEVRIQDVTVFRPSVQCAGNASGNGSADGGEVLVFGVLHASVDGLRVSGFRTGFGNVIPGTRVSFIASGRAFLARRVEVQGSSAASELARDGLISTVAGGIQGATEPSSEFMAVFESCRASKNLVALFGSAGFIKNNVSVRYVDCAAFDCGLGLWSLNGSVFIESGIYSGNRDEGVRINLATSTTAVFVSGATIVNNATAGAAPGLSIFPGFGSSWNGRGPRVMNNRVVDNGTGTTPQIFIGTSLGSTTAPDIIGGVCIGNFCRSSSAATAIIRVDVSTTYRMRGLGTDDDGTILIWATKARTATPPGTAFAEMIFNDAVWDRN
jgi:hypothetical protein